MLIFAGNTVDCLAFFILWLAFFAYVLFSLRRSA